MQLPSILACFPGRSRFTKTNFGARARIEARVLCRVRAGNVRALAYEREEYKLRTALAKFNRPRLDLNYRENFVRRRVEEVKV